MSGGVFQLTGNPVGISTTRLPAAADEWAHFRIKNLRFRMHPSGSGVGTQAAGWVGGVQDTPPATVGDVMELLPAVVLSSYVTVPTDWVRVPKTDLAGPLPWYKSIAGGADATEEAPGAIRIVGTSTDTFKIEVCGVFEFKTAVATGNTPVEVELRRKLRAVRLESELLLQRDRLLKVISTPAKGGV